MNWYNKFKEYIIPTNIKIEDRGLVKILNNDGTVKTHKNKISGNEWNNLISYVEKLEQRLTLLEVKNNV